jgi:hypothetical protein
MTTQVLFENFTVVYLHFFCFQILASILLTANLWQSVKAGLYPVAGRASGNTFAYFNGPVPVSPKPVILNSAGSGGGAGAQGTVGSVTLHGGAAGLGAAGLPVTSGGLSIDYSVSKIIPRR